MTKSILLKNVLVVFHYYIDEEMFKSCHGIHKNGKIADLTLAQLIQIIIH